MSAKLVIGTAAGFASNFCCFNLSVDTFTGRFGCDAWQCKASRRGVQHARRWKQASIHSSVQLSGRTSCPMLTSNEEMVCKASAGGGGSKAVPLLVASWVATPYWHTYVHIKFSTEIEHINMYTPTYTRINTLVLTYKRMYVRSGVLTSVVKYVRSYARPHAHSPTHIHTVR